MGWLGVQTSLFNVALEFWSEGPQIIWAGINTSESIELSTGPHKCVWGVCSASRSSPWWLPIKLAHLTPVVGLVTNNDELVPWWKTKKIVIQDRTPPVTIDGAVMERMSSSKFLELAFSEDLSWTTDTIWLATKAQKHLSKPKRAHGPPPIRGPSKCECHTPWECHCVVYYVLWCGMETTPPPVTLSEPARPPGPLCSP